jgi:hypothetical protein
MWKVLPRVGLVKAIAFLFATLFLSVILIFLGDDNYSLNLSFNNLLEVAAHATGISLIFSFFIWLIAKWGWKGIWFIPKLDNLLNKHVCPNLNGKWVGQITSTFKDENGDSVSKTVEMSISADFIGFDIRLRSLDQYQRSTVVQSEIFKDTRNGNFYISYLFESVIDQPLPTDDSKFDGAAKLAVRFEENNILLVGTYWTNRAWQRGQNTAGKIELRRE